MTISRSKMTCGNLQREECHQNEEFEIYALTVGVLLPLALLLLLLTRDDDHNQDDAKKAKQQPPSKEDPDLRSTVPKSIPDFFPG